MTPSHSVTGAGGSDSRQSPPATAYRVGDWVVNPGLRTLSREGSTTRLEPKVMLVLLCLIRRAGEPVSREELERDAWKGAFIGPDTLNRSVSKLRRAFGDDPQSPGVIETIPKSGYRLIAPVQPLVTAEHEDRRVPRRLGHVATAALVVASAAGITLWLSAVGWRTEAAAPSESGVAVPLTSAAGYEAAPTMSPSGRHVAFQSVDILAPGPRSWDIYIRSVDGEGQWTPFATSEMNEYAAAWSPAGDSLAFVVSGADDCGIYLGAALGGRRERVADCDPASYYHLAWTADARSLAVADGSGAIELLQRTDGRASALTDPPAGFAGDVYPAFDPTGRYLGYVRRKIDGVDDLYVLDRNSGMERRLTSDNRVIGGVAFAPDGASILFTSRRAGNSQLWEIDLAGGPPRRIPISGRHASGIAVGPDGTVVYSEYTGDTNVRFRVMGSGDTLSSSTRFTTSTRSDWAPALSPDERWIAFVSDRGGNPEIWVTRADSAAPQQVTRLGAGVLNAPRWSPDGGRLVFEAIVDDHFDVYTVHVGSGQPTRVSLATTNERAPSWSSDGQRVYYASDRRGEWLVYRHDLHTGQSDPVTMGGGFASREAPDGTSVIVTRHDAPGVWRAGGNGVAEELLWGGVAPADWNNWELTGDGVRYFRTGAASGRFEWYDFARERVTVLGHESREIDVKSGLAVSRDGTRWWYATVDRSESDLWVLRR